MKRRQFLIMWILSLGLVALVMIGEDVRVRPAPDAGLVVTDSTGQLERLRVDEDGGVYMPGLASHPAPELALCTDAATGLVGTCPQAEQGPQGPQGPEGPTGPAGPQGPAGASGREIRCNVSSQTFSCGFAQCVLNNYILNATCPPGYTRLSLVSCSRPSSSTLTAQVFVDPFEDNIFGCRYNGTFPAFSTENLTIKILCIERICPIG